MRPVLCALLGILLLGPAPAAARARQEHPLEPPDVSSPRATLQSFIDNAREAWRVFFAGGGSGRETYDEANRYLHRAIRCFDPAGLASDAVEGGAGDTVILLLEVLERVDLPPPQQIPDLATVETEGIDRWVLPRTEIEIARVEEGPDEGEFLFTAETVDRAREFYERTRHLAPGRDAVDGASYELYTQLPGWMIPLASVESLPAWMQGSRLGQPVWKLLGLLLVLTIVALGSEAARRWARRPTSADPVGAGLRRLVFPVACLLLLLLGRYAVWHQLAMIGTVWNVVSLGLTGLAYLVMTWGVILVGNLFTEAFLASPRIDPMSVDASVFRIAARVVSIAVAVLVLVEGARAVGVPVFGVLAGLGVGGLAVALAAQSTLENFIGSITIFADRPVRVGDFCRFGDRVGTIEQIGLRSTRVRTLERTLVTVPNAEFSKMQLDNISARDSILIRTELSLRYETTQAQLEGVLKGFEQMLRTHPRIKNEPIRVRLTGFGDYAYEIEVFAYADSQDWDDFLAIRQDVYMRMIEVVENMGAAFAVPAQATYLTGESAAQAQLESWRSESDASEPGGSGA